MAKSINLPFPVDWPPSLTGQISIGLRNTNGEGKCLWLQFDVQGGHTVGVVATVTDDGTYPDDQFDTRPDVLVATDLSTWQLAQSEPAAFYAAVESGQVHIGGDFRFFTRHVASFLGLLGACELPEEVDTILASLNET